MQSDSVRRRNNGTRDDVVSVHQRTSNWFADAVNVHRRSTDESDNEANRCRKKARDHKNTEPTNIKTVVRRSHPGTEIIPEISIRTCSDCSSHLIKRVSMNSGGLNGYSILHDTLHRGYEGCFTSRDPGWRRHEDEKLLLFLTRVCIYNNTVRKSCQ